MQNNPLHKILLVATFGLFMLNFSPVLAQVMEIEVLGGGYRLRGPDVISFDDVTASFTEGTSIRDLRDLDAQNEESLANGNALDYIAIEDQNGGNPFVVAVSATDFASDSNDFANTNFEIKNANGDGDTTDDIIPENSQTTETGVQLDASTDSYIDLSAQRVLFSSEGRAPGAWRIYPVLRINIPAETPPGAYSSTLTFTIF